MYSVLGLGITKACIFIFRDEYTCKFFYHVYVYLSLSLYIYIYGKPNVFPVRFECLVLLGCFLETGFVLSFDVLQLRLDVAKCLIMD